MAEQFGYHTGDVLESILAGQEAKKRQAMIDDINKQNIQSEISARQDNAATNRFNRESLAADRKSKDDERNTELTHEKALGEWAATQHSDDPTIQSMYGIVAQHPHLGKDLFPRIYDQIIANEGKKKPMVPAYRLPFGSSKAEPIMQDAPVPMIGQVPRMVPQGSPEEFVHEGQPTQPRQAPAAEVVPQQYYIEEYNDPSDPSKGTKQVPYFETPANFKKLFDTKTAAGVVKGSRKGNLPPPSGKPPYIGYNQSVLTSYQNSLQNKAATTPQERAAKLQAFIATIQNPKYRDDVNKIIAHPQARNMTVDDLVKNGSLTADPSDPDYLTNVGSILGVIRGQ